MTKPWKENWELDGDGDARRLNRKGERSDLVFLMAASGDWDKQRLAVTAPRLYRALEALMGIKGLSAYVGSTEEWSEAMAALKAARGEE